jgi:hypothetical protein
MPQAMRDGVLLSVQGIAASNPITNAQALKRAQTAVYLVASSSQYQVQR